MKPQSIFLNLVSTGQTIEEWEHDLVKESWKIITGASNVRTVSRAAPEPPTKGVGYRAVIYHGGVEIPSTNHISDPQLFTDGIHRPLIKKGWCVKPHWEVLMLVSQLLPRERIDGLGLAALVLSLPDTTSALSLEYVRNQLTIRNGFPHNIWRDHVGFVFVVP